MTDKAKAAEKGLIEDFESKTGHFTLKTEVAFNVLVDEISKSISDSISSVSEISAPITVFLLREYADEISRHFKCTAEFQQLLNFVMSKNKTTVTTETRQQ